MIDPKLKHYIETEIIPQYDRYDPAHQSAHVYQVIENSLLLAQDFDVDVNIVYTVAAYHDIGLRYGRFGHETSSKYIVFDDLELRKFFSPQEIQLIGEAVEDHRASIEYEPRSIYGKIVSEADRDLDIGRIIDRTIRFIHEYYPQASYDYILMDTYHYLKDKYGSDSDLKLWLNHPETLGQLAQLRKELQDMTCFSQIFNELYQSIRDGKK